VSAVWEWIGEGMYVRCRGVVHAGVMEIVALRWEEQLIPRAWLSTDRDGTDDDLSEGGFHLPFPPCSGTTGVAQEPRSGKFVSTSSS
jgi:hypothetical protein